jgi:hypothetical protein
MIRALAIASLASLWLCACGRSSLSTQQLRSQSSRPCRIATRELARIPTPASPSGEAGFLKRGIAVLAPELRSLRGLQPPSGLAHEFSSALRAGTQVLAALRESAHRLATGGDPVVSIKTLQLRLARLETEANSAWEALGIPACVSR